MYSPLKMGIFQPAMLVYWRITKYEGFIMKATTKQKLRFHQSPPPRSGFFCHQLCNFNHKPWNPLGNNAISLPATFEDDDWFSIFPVFNGIWYVRSRKKSEGLPLQKYLPKISLQWTKVPYHDIAASHVWLSFLALFQCPSVWLQAWPSQPAAEIGEKFASRFSALGIFLDPKICWSTTL